MPTQLSQILAKDGGNLWSKPGSPNTLVLLTQHMQSWDCFDSFYFWYRQHFSVWPEKDLDKFKIPVDLIYKRTFPDASKLLLPFLLMNSTLSVLILVVATAFLQSPHV